MTYERGTRVQARQGRSWRPGTVACKAVQGQHTHVSVKLDHVHEPVAVSWIHVRKLSVAQPVPAYGPVADAPVQHTAAALRKPSSTRRPDAPVVVELHSDDEEEKEEGDGGAETQSRQPDAVDVERETLSTGDLVRPNVSPVNSQPAAVQPTYSNHHASVSNGSVAIDLTAPSQAGPSNAPGTLQGEEERKANTRAWLTAKKGDRLASDLLRKTSRTPAPPNSALRRPPTTTAPFVLRSVPAPPAPAARNDPTQPFSFARAIGKESLSFPQSRERVASRWDPTATPRLSPRDHSTTAPLFVDLEQQQDPYSNRHYYSNFTPHDRNNTVPSYKNDREQPQFEDFSLGARHPNLNLDDLHIPRAKDGKGAIPRLIRRTSNAAPSTNYRNVVQVPPRPPLAKRVAPSGPPLFPEGVRKRRRFVNGPAIARGFSVTPKFPLGKDTNQDEEDVKVLKICDEITKNTACKVDDSSSESEPEPEPESEDNLITYRGGRKRSRKSVPTRLEYSRRMSTVPPVMYCETEQMQQVVADGRIVSCRCKAQRRTALYPESETLQCAHCFEWSHKACLHLKETSLQGPFPSGQSVQSSFMCIDCADQFITENTTVTLSRDIQRRSVPGKPLCEATASSYKDNNSDVTNLLSTSRPERPRARSHARAKNVRSVIVQRKAENVDILCTSLGALSVQGASPYLRSLKK